MRRELQPPYWPPDPGENTNRVVLTIVSGPVTCEADAAFPGITRRRTWVRWYDDRTGWRTHLMLCIVPLVQRVWQLTHEVLVVDAVNGRQEASPSACSSTSTPTLF